MAYQPLSFKKQNPKLKLKFKHLSKLPLVVKTHTLNFQLLPGLHSLSDKELLKIHNGPKLENIPEAWLFLLILVVSHCTHPNNNAFKSF